ncbi:hypothetical protein KUCAC02_000741 [Chaenocephalus aceratus]|uniref:Uncharacterized protein n=1 Tax=Chaenocephalus aceratus TaxID=36190 RepID=A0ACB9W7Z0_CHAAC|nr:hypothetical protein KUCAC02_000741 [Chaenocephalus aceratus]
MLLSFYETGSHFNGLKKKHQQEKQCGVELDWNQFCRSVCLERFWDCEKEKGESSFPQGRETFTRRQSWTFTLMPSLKTFTLSPALKTFTLRPSLKTFTLSPALNTFTLRPSLKTFTLSPALKTFTLRPSL